LISKGIEFDDTVQVPYDTWKLVTKGMRKIEAQAQELAELKCLVKDDSDSDSENSDMDYLGQSSDEEDVDEDEALEAYRYLESLGLVLTDVADVKECVDLAALLSLDEGLITAVAESKDDH
jgi:hypothetical protein